MENSAARKSASEVSWVWPGAAAGGQAYGLGLDFLATLFPTKEADLRLFYELKVSVTIPSDILLLIINSTLVAEMWKIVAIN